MQATQPEAPLQPTSPPPPLLGLPPLTISNHHLMAKVFGLSQMAPHLASSPAFQDQLDRFLCVGGGRGGAVRVQGGITVQPS